MKKLMVQRIFIFILAILGLRVVSCTTTSYGVIAEGETATPEEAVYNAEEYLNTRPNWDIDCSHFVLDCYHSQKMNDYCRTNSLHRNLTYTLNAYLRDQKTRRLKFSDIKPGDILIFNKTYDMYHNGHIDDRDFYTHTGIVEYFKKGLVVYIDASSDRKPPRIHRRRFSFTDDGINETVARDPATGRKIHARETFYAAYAVP